MEHNSQFRNLKGVKEGQRKHGLHGYGAGKTAKAPRPKQPMKGGNTRMGEDIFLYEGQHITQSGGKQF